MTKFFTHDFKLQTINAIIDSSPSYYIFLGRHLPYVDDSNPPALYETVQETYTDVYNNMITAKRVRPSDMAALIPRVDWVSGVVYKPYEHDVSLHGTAFYVVVFSGSTYDVFKCLSNNNDAPSTVAPSLSQTSASDDIYETSDGYQWKYLYSMFEIDFKKFATVDYMPVYNNANVVAAAVNGSIDYVKVTHGGSGYDCFTNGTFQSISVGGNNQTFWIESTASANNNYYKNCAIKVTSGSGAGQQRNIIGYEVSGSTRKVVVDQPFTVAPTTSSTYEITPGVLMVGSGNNFVGRALVNAAASNSIYKVEITNRGQGFVYATGQITGNVASISNTATFKPMISPPGGHGSNPARELGANYLGLTVTFNSANVTATDKVYDTNDFRVFGVINNPLFANLVVNYTGANGTFIHGERITQADTGATGIILTSNTTSLVLTDATGNFLPGNSTFREIIGQTSGIGAEVITITNNGSAVTTDGVEYASQLTYLSLTGSSGTFVADELVTGTGNTQTSNAYVYAANTTGVWLTNVKGTFGNTITGLSSGVVATITDTKRGDFVYGSGEVVYLENISPINKSEGQTETIKAIIEF